jgi:phosphate:Na+ symporter
LLSGLGLFFIGVRLLSANLVPLVGRRARAVFAGALRGPASSALSGLAAGLLTQSSTAVSWIILGLVRAGLPATAWVLVAPAWANVGTALLPILVAVNLATSASLVIGLVGFATYFKLDNTDRRRHALDAALGAALLLFGMQIVSSSVGPVRDALIANGVLAIVTNAPILLALIGIGFSLITQSSSVATAIAVAGVNNGLLTIDSALPLIAGANAAGILNNALKLRGETAMGLTMFSLQILQKAAGTILLAALAAAAYLPSVSAVLGSRHPSFQIALIFTIAQLAGALIAASLSAPVASWFARHRRPSSAEILANPQFLLRESLNDPPAAINLALRELARLAARVPLLLDHVRANPDDTAPPTATLRDAGVALTAAIKTYLLNLLDHHPGRDQVAAALLLENATGSIADLHEALAGIATAAPDAASLPAAGRLIESLHVLMGFIADHAASLGADDPDFVLRLLGDRNAMMTELRQRLATDEGASAEAQDALFRISMLFERAVWLARRFVTDLAQVNTLLAK